MPAEIPNGPAWKLQGMPEKPASPGPIPARPAHTSGQTMAAPAPAPASVTPAELHEALRRAGLSSLNPGQQADFLKGLQAITALAARLPRDLPLAAPLGFDFRPDLHAPPPPPPAAPRPEARSARRPAAKKAAAGTRRR